MAENKLHPTTAQNFCSAVADYNVINGKFTFEFHPPSLQMIVPMHTF